MTFSNLTVKSVFRQKVRLTIVYVRFFLKQWGFFCISTHRTYVHSACNKPTVRFTILELSNRSHDVPELHKIRRSADFEALVLWKGSSGTYEPNGSQNKRKNLTSGQRRFPIVPLLQLWLGLHLKRVTLDRPNLRASRSANR